MHIRTAVKIMSVRHGDTTGGRFKVTQQALSSVLQRQLLDTDTFLLSVVFCLVVIGGDGMMVVKVSRASYLSGTYSAHFQVNHFILDDY